MVIHHFRMKINTRELLDEEVELVVPLQFLDRLLYLEILDDVIDIFREAYDVVFEVDADIFRVLFQAREVVF